MRPVAPGPGRPGLLEFEYVRGGTLAYLAAWDVHHANLFDRIEQTTGIIPFGRLVDQIEIYFSIVQCKALTPNDFATLPELARQLIDFGQHYRTIAEPFEWTFTRAKLDAVIEKITRHEPQPLAHRRMNRITCGRLH